MHLLRATFFPIWDRFFSRLVHQERMKNRSRKHWKIVDFLNAKPQAMFVFSLLDLSSLGTALIRVSSYRPSKRAGRVVTSNVCGRYATAAPLGSTPAMRRSWGGV